MKNPLNQMIRGVLLPFVGLFAEKEGLFALLMILQGIPWQA